MLLHNRSVGCLTRRRSAEKGLGRHTSKPFGYLMRNDATSHFIGGPTFPQSLRFEPVGENLPGEIAKVSIGPIFPQSLRFKVEGNKLSS